jgi:hypothetical protein
MSEVPVELTVRGWRAAPELRQRDNEPLALDCTVCLEESHCGGMRNHSGGMGCMALCCGDPPNCFKHACPRKPDEYVDLVRDVDGLELRPFRGLAAPIPKLPSYIPVLLNRGARRKAPPAVAVAVSLYDVLDARTALARFKSGLEMREWFRVSTNTKLVLSGVQEDPFVERFWTKSHARDTAESLRALRPALVTVPNFSIHLHKPRHDSMISMARIARVACEFASAQLPTAVHVNGAGRHDFNRWARFLRDSPFLSCVSFEFGTAARTPKERDRFAGYLEDIAQQVGRPLTLVMKGGLQSVGRLGRTFARIVYLDTTALSKAKHWKSAKTINGNLKWSSVDLAPHGQIDELFAHNTRVMSRTVQRLLPLPVRNTPTRVARREIEPFPLFESL